MSADLAALMNSTSPMASPIAAAAPQPSAVQQSMGAAQNYAGAAHRAMQQQFAGGEDMYDEPLQPRAQQQQPRGGGGDPYRQMPNNVLSSLLDDPDKKVTLVVLALLVLAQHAQTREFARSIAKSAGVSLSDSPYEHVAIAIALTAGFYYFLINYM